MEADNRGSLRHCHRVLVNFSIAIRVAISGAFIHAHSTPIRVEDEVAHPGLVPANSQGIDWVDEAVLALLPLLFTVVLDDIQRDGPLRFVVLQEGLDSHEVFILAIVGVD